MWISLGIFFAIVIIIIVVLILRESINDNKINDNREKFLQRFQDKINKEEQESFGKAGENYVVSMLEYIQSHSKAYLFNNYTFMDDDGYSSNIDHIFVCKGGVFVIETKSNKGIIYGNDSDDMWYAQKEAWQDDKEFKNPVKQNHGHIYHLRKMFKNNPPKMYSLVVFPVAESLENINSNIVFDIDSAYEYIMEKINESKYSEQFIERINKDLIDIINLYGITIEEHNENLKNKYSNQNLFD